MEADPDECSYPGMEVLEWDLKHKNSVTGVAPSPSYNKFSENARKIISGDNQCAMFCRGKKCKYCTWDHWTINTMAIDGLYSNWITDKILAMSRPTTRALKEKKVLKQFIATNIKTVINLQVPGEHASCGDGNEESGFSYNPQVLMDNQLYFYNFGWDDFGVGSTGAILDIVKVMQFAVTEGKVAIHCHAGLGRTGLLIACYLVFNNRISASDAIHYVRHKRPGSIQSSLQVNCVHEFESYLKPFRVIFAKLAGHHEVSLRQFLNRQKHLLHGFEARKLKYIPKVVYICCERLLQLANHGKPLEMFQKAGSVLNLSPPSEMDTKSSSASPLTYSSFVTDDSQSTSSQSPSSQSPSSSSRSRSYNNINDQHFKDVLTICDEENSVKSSDNPENVDDDVDDDDDDDDDCIVYGYSKDKHKLIEQAPSYSSYCDTAGSSHRRRICNIHKHTTKQLLAPSSTAVPKMKEEFSEQVAEAMSASEYSSKVEKKVEKLKMELNHSDEVWSKLATETNAFVLSAVLWDWLDQLKEPILNLQDLHKLLSSAEMPLLALQKVEKHIKHMIEYLAKVMVRLQPLPESMERRVLERLLSHLTHQIVKKDVLSYEATKPREHWEEMKSKTADRLFVLFLSLMLSLSSHEK